MRHSAQQFARAAVENYSVQDAAFVYLHAGASVELAIKAALCRISPVLLLEGQRFSDHALIRLSGYNPASDGTPGSRIRPVFSVGFDGAIKRLQLLYGADVLSTDQPSLEILKAARDVTAHGGAVGEAGNETLLIKGTDVLRKVHAALSPLLDMTPEAFWGDSYSVIQEASELRKGSLSRLADAIVKSAKYRFNQRCIGLDEETIQSMIDQAGQRVEPTGNDEWYRICPVCGSTGLSHQRPAKRTVLRSRKQHVERGWMATDFRCVVCKLYLESEELVEAVRDFDSWYVASDDFLEFWIDDMGETVTAEDVRDLGLE